MPFTYIVDTNPSTQSNPDTFSTFDAALTHIYNTHGVFLSDGGDAGLVTLLFRSSNGVPLYENVDVNRFAPNGAPNRLEVIGQMANGYPAVLVDTVESTAGYVFRNYDDNIDVYGEEEDSFIIRGNPAQTQYGRVLFDIAKNMSKLKNIVLDGVDSAFYGGFGGTGVVTAENIKIVRCKRDFFGAIRNGNLSLDHCTINDNKLIRSAENLTNCIVVDTPFTGSDGIGPGSDYNFYTNTEASIVYSQAKTTEDANSVFELDVATNLLIDPVGGFNLADGSILAGADSTGGNPGAWASGVVGAPPVVAIELNGETLTALVSDDLTANPLLQLFIDSSPVGDSQTSTIWDLTTYSLSTGVYRLTVQATDDDNNTSTSNQKYHSVGGVLRILWIGNSLSQTPVEPSGASLSVIDVVEAMFANAGTQVLIDKALLGGASFIEHRANQETLDKISTGNYDLILCQHEARGNPATLDYQTYLDTELKPMMDLAKSVGSDWVGWSHQPFGDDTEGLYNDRQANNSATLTYYPDFQLINIMGAWWNVRQADPTIDLYADNIHQNSGGAYISALGIYKFLTGTAASAVGYVDPILTAPLGTDGLGYTAAQLTTIVEQTDLAVTNQFVRSSPNSCVISITSPIGATTVTEGDSVTFTATAEDSVDGDVTANIEWRDSSNTLLHTGGTFSTTTLPTGKNLITANCLGSDGNTATAARSVTVRTLNNVAPVTSDSTREVDYNSAFTQVNLVVTDDNDAVDFSTLVITRQPLYGTATKDGQTLSTVNLDYSGTNYVGADSFAYTVKDTDGLTSNESTVFITVKPKARIVASLVSNTITRGSTVTIGLDRYTPTVDGDVNYIEVYLVDTVTGIEYPCTVTRHTATEVDVEVPDTDVIDSALSNAIFRILPVKTIGISNAPPVIADQLYNVTVGDDLVIDLDLLTKDVNGDIVSFAVSNHPNIRDGVTSTQKIFNGYAIGTQKFLVTVTDSHGAKDTATFVIVISPESGSFNVPSRPVYATTTTDVIIVLGDATDDQGNVINYNVSGTTYYLAGPATNEITYNAPIPVNESIVVTGDNGLGETQTGTITMSVTEASTQIPLSVAYQGWSTMKTDLSIYNSSGGTPPPVEHDPSVYKIVGQMYAANGLSGYLDDFHFLTQGSWNIDAQEALDHVNGTSGEVYVISVYGATGGITLDPVLSNSVPPDASEESNTGWIDRFVNIAEAAEIKGMTPIVYQCWGHANDLDKYADARTNMDNLLAKKGMLVIRTAEIVERLGQVNIAYITNTETQSGVKYEPPVEHLYSGAQDDQFHGSYAMMYMAALATFKALTGITAAENAFTIPSSIHTGDNYGMADTFIDDIIAAVDLIQVESIISGLAPGATPISTTINRTGYHDTDGMINVGAASKLQDDAPINSDNFAIKTITASNFNSYSLVDGVFLFNPVSTFTGVSVIVFTYTDTQDQTIDITMNLTIEAVPVIPSQEIIIGFGLGNWSSFTAAGDLYNHTTTSGGKVINGIRAFEQPVTQGTLQDSTGAGIGSVTAMIGGVLEGLNFRANGDGDPDTYGPYPELYEGLSTGNAGTTVRFSVNGLDAGVNYRVNMAGRYPSSNTNVVDVDVNGVKGSYDCDNTNITEFEKVVKADKTGRLVVTLSSDGTSVASRWGISYLHINKITDGTAADVPAPPEFITHPQNSSVTQGLPVTFTAEALAADRYQWYFDNAIVQGETSPSWTFTTANGQDGAEVKVEAHNNGGVTMSSIATLTLITNAPTISVQPPATLNVIEGKTQSLSVSAVGAQWYKWYIDGVEVPGEESSTYTKTAELAEDGVTITIEVGNDFGSIISNGTVLTVAPKQPEYWLQLGRNDGTAQDFTDSYAGWKPGSRALGANGQEINFIRAFSQSPCSLTNVFRNTDGTLTDLTITATLTGTNQSSIASWGEIDDLGHTGVDSALNAKDWLIHLNSYGWRVYFQGDHELQLEFENAELVIGEEWMVQVVGIHYQDATRPVNLDLNGNTDTFYVGAWDEFTVGEVIAVVDGNGKLTLTITPDSNANISGIRLIKTGN